VDTGTSWYNELKRDKLPEKRHYSNRSHEI
jgi:hypothetical protein